jgi:cobalt transporter subunit CbtA
MITRVLATGLLAGLLAGLCVAALQTVTTTPIILEAEVFEKADAAQSQALLPSARHSGALLQQADLVLVHAGHGAAHDDGAAQWEPQDGLERTFFTSTATIATAIGFALILLAAMLVARDPIDERHAIAWAAAAFVVTGLAPAVGLSPELPGMVAADLASRQAWWFLTAATTALGLWLFLRSDNAWLRLLAVPIVLAPHVWGAPRLAEAVATSVPAELAARFAATSLAVQAVLWLSTGFFVGFLWRRLGGGDGHQPA